MWHDCDVEQNTQNVKSDGYWRTSKCDLGDKWQRPACLCEAPEEALEPCEDNTTPSFAANLSAESCFGLVSSWAAKTGWTAQQLCMTSLAQFEQVARIPPPCVPYDKMCTSSGNDCYACDASLGMDCGGWQEAATCRDGYFPVAKGRHSHYACYPNHCAAEIREMVPGMSRRLADESALSGNGGVLADLCSVTCGLEGAGNCSGVLAPKCTGAWCR
jgi:hypothetical protein